MCSSSSPVRALRLLARAHAMEGHREDALSLFRALAEAVPRDAEASVHIGYEYALGSENELAQEAFSGSSKSKSNLT